MSEQINAPQPITPVVIDAVSSIDEATQRVLNQQVASIENLTRELDRANERVETFRQREHNAENRYNLFRDAVIGWFSDAVSEGTLTKDEANGGLDALQLPRITTKWRVTVTDRDYNTVLVVVVEADDESDAIDQVQGDISVSATVKAVEYDLSYSGDGEVVEGEDTYEEEPDDDGDDYADSWKDDLTFEAEEEE